MENNNTLGNELMTHLEDEISNKKFAEIDVDDISDNLPYLATIHKLQFLKVNNLESFVSRIKVLATPDESIYYLTDLVLSIKYDSLDRCIVLIASEKPIRLTDLAKDALEADGDALFFSENIDRTTQCLIDNLVCDNTSVQLLMQDCIIKNTPLQSIKKLYIDDIEADPDNCDRGYIAGFPLRPVFIVGYDEGMLEKYEAYAQLELEKLTQQKMDEQYDNNVITSQSKDKTMIKLSGKVALPSTSGMVIQFSAYQLKLPDEHCVVILSDKSHTIESKVVGSDYLNASIAKCEKLGLLYTYENMYIDVGDNDLTLELKTYHTDEMVQHVTVKDRARGRKLEYTENICTWQNIHIGQSYIKCKRLIIKILSGAGQTGTRQTGAGQKGAGQTKVSVDIQGCMLRNIESLTVITDAKEPIHLHSGLQSVLEERHIAFT